MIRPTAILVATALAASSCGYRLVTRDLPAAAGSCVRFEGLEGGGTHPRVATWTSAALRQELAADLCPGGGPGPLLAGQVEAVGQISSHTTVDDSGPVRAGGRWRALATVRIEEGGRILWGPQGVEVERDFLSTGSALTEQAALDEHLRLLSGDLAHALAEVIYGVHPVVIESEP